MSLSTLGTDQAYLQRYFTTKSLAEGRRSVLLDAVIAVPVSALLFAMGDLLYAFYHFHADRLRGLPLVDVYDAIRAKRPHKPALSHIAAVQMMTEASSGQFDPALLRTFEKTHQIFEKIFRQTPD